MPTWPSARSRRRARGGWRRARRRRGRRRDAAEHPAQAELLRRDPLVVGEGEPAVVPLDVDQRQAGLDPQHHQRLLAERPDAVAAPGLEHRVEHVERLLGLDRDLEAEVAGVAGAGQGDRRGADLGLGVLEEGERLGLRHQGGQHGPRAGALDGEDAVVVGDVLDLDPQPPARSVNQPRLGRAAVSRKSVSECRKTTPSSITNPRSSHQSVYWAARPAGADVADEHAGQEAARRRGRGSGT